MDYLSAIVRPCMLGIFVGGQSRRMAGFPKGLLEHPRAPATTLVENWIALAKALSTPCVLVGRHSAYTGFDMPILDDNPSGVGPIGGLHALLEHCERLRLHAVAVACDMPFASSTLLRRLCSAEPSAGIVAPRDAQTSIWEPLFARYDPKRVLGALREQLAARRYSLQALVDCVGGTPLAMTPQEWPELEDWDDPAAMRAAKSAVARESAPDCYILGNIQENSIGENAAMSQANVASAEAPFLAKAELWSGHPSPNVPMVGLFAAERLWATLEATVLTIPAERGQSATAVLGIPWYVNGTRQTCLLLGNATDTGTLEVWHFDPEREQLRLSSGNFGKWEEFKRITALTRFRPGEGLPGRVWKSGCPVLLEDLGESKAFLRAEAAQSVGLQSGLALPVRYATGTGVAVLLWSRISPLGRSVDLWKASSNSRIEHMQGLNFATSASDHTFSLSVAQRLALDAATRFTPTVLVQDSDLRARSLLHFGFAWPSIDEQGKIHVATVVG